MKKQQIAILVLAMVATASVAFAWFENDNENEAMLLAQTKVSLTQAIENALTTVPEKALSAELNDEGQLAYLVEVVQQDGTYEVTVDALNGKIIGKSLDKVDDEKHDREDRD